MRWKSIADRMLVAKKEKMARDSEWHRSFAFVPHKTITGEVVWLEPVDRRFTGDFPHQYDGLFLLPFAYWEYRFPQEPRP